MKTIVDLIESDLPTHSMPVIDNRGNLFGEINQLSLSLGIDAHTLRICVTSIEKDKGYSCYKFAFIDQDAASDFYNIISKSHVYGDEAKISNQSVSFRAAGGQGRLLDKVIKSLNGLNGEREVVLSR